MSEIKPEDYLVGSKMTKILEQKFNSDLYTRDFDPEDLGTFLCAQAYGCIGKEIFYDAKMATPLLAMAQASGKKLGDKSFYDGMVTYSILSKIATVQAALDSSEFATSKSLDMSQLSADNFDYATQAFALFYAYTKGYVCDWSKINHAYSALNFGTNPNVRFEATGEEIDPKILIDKVAKRLEIIKAKEETNIR